MFNWDEVDISTWESLATKERIFKVSLKTERQYLFEVHITEYAPQRWSWGMINMHGMWTEKDYSYLHKSGYSERNVQSYVHRVLVENFFCPICKLDFGLCDACEEQAIDEIVLEYLKLRREEV